MDIQKEREAFEAVTNIYHCIYNADLNYYFSGSQFVGNKAEIAVNAGWKAWQAAKAQAVPEWFDYTKQSPQIDGNYQIFIKGEQITAKWVSRFGFADPIEGDALRQELITHWAMQPQPPKAQEPAND